MATAGLTLVNLAVFVASLALGEGVTLLLSVTPDVNGAGWLRLVGYQFAHVNAGHLLINLTGFVLFAILLERHAGAARIAALYVGSGLAGAALWLASSSNGGYLAGASASVFGVAFYTALACGVRARWLAIVFAMLVGLMFVPAGHIGHAAHLGGATFGWLAWLVRRRRRAAR